MTVTKHTEENLKILNTLSLRPSDAAKLLDMPSKTQEQKVAIVNNFRQRNKNSKQEIVVNSTNVEAKSTLVEAKVNTTITIHGIKLIFVEVPKYVKVSGHTIEIG